MVTLDDVSSTCVARRWLRHPIGFIRLVPRAALVKVRCVHGPNIFGYLFERLVYIVLIALQVVVQTVNLEVDLIDHILHSLIFFVLLLI